MASTHSSSGKTMLRDDPHLDLKKESILLTIAYPACPPLLLLILLAALWRPVVLLFESLAN